MLKNKTIVFINSLKAILVKKTVLLFFLIPILICLLAPFIANDRPLVCYYKNNILFPSFSNKHLFKISESEFVNYDMGQDWKRVEADFCLFPLCSYLPNTMDAENSFKSPIDKQYFRNSRNELESLPFYNRHWLGTTQNGNDVLSGIIYGTRVSLSVGFFSALVAGIIGVLLGIFAGYYGNRGLELGFFQLFFVCISVLYSCFLVSTFRIQLYFWNDFIISFTTIIGVMILLVYASNKLGKYVDDFFRLKTRIAFPVDVVITRLIELLNSIPTLLLIITLSTVFRPSNMMLILIISFLSWTSIARLTRAEVMKAKELNYVLAYKAMGMLPLRIMFLKILPNIFSVIFVQLLFVFSSAIIIESSLSFIGLSVSTNAVSWGSLMAEARENFSAWWLVLFPGFCIFIITYACHKIQINVNSKLDNF